MSRKTTPDASARFGIGKVQHAPAGGQGEMRVPGAQPPMPDTAILAEARACAKSPFNPFPFRSS